MTIAQFHQTCQRLDGGSDQALGKYVVRTSVVQQLSQFASPAQVAVGLKGIGKSSAYRYLTDFDSTANVVVAITPETHQSGITDRRLNFAACRRQFEQDLVIEALRAVDAKAAELKKKGIDSQLLKRAAAQVNIYIEALKTAAGRWRGLGVSVLGTGFTVTRGDAPTLIGLTNAEDFSTARAVLEELCSNGVTIRIVVDDPELVFSDRQDLDPHLVGGFLLAGLSLASRVPNFKVVSFVKTHVYHPVRAMIEDFSKYPDHQSRLGWSLMELEQVVDRRLKWTKTDWQALFDVKTDTEAKAEIAKMVQEIRSGPRDLLRWLDLALQKSPKGGVTSKVWRDSKRQMSKDSMKEMESAHAATYPKVGDVIKAIFSSGPTKHFTHAGFRQHILKQMVNDTRLKALLTVSWMQRESSDSLPDVLLEVGALGLLGQSGMLLPYSPDYDHDAMEEADQVSLVPAFREAVSIR